MKQSPAVCRGALLRFGLLFLPAGPALLWLWPNLLPGTPAHDAIQCLAYLYFLGGAAWIGRRAWTWAGLGISWQGLGLSLGCGVVLLALLACGRLALDQPLQAAALDVPRLAWELLFYVGFVGITEEFLFRGLLYRILEDWSQPAVAVLGTSAGFALWHIGWAGPLQLGGLFLIGLLFGLIRRRAGGIAGLVVIHGAYDIAILYLYQGVDRDTLSLLSITNRGFALLGDILVVGLMVYLLFLHPRLARWN